MKVQILAPGQPPERSTGPVRDLGGGPLDHPADASSYDGWRPRCVLGADSPFGLSLPPAQASASTMYAPRGVWTDGRLRRGHRHRQPPGADLARAARHRRPARGRGARPGGRHDARDPAAGGRGPAAGMHLPTGVLVHDGRLVVADAWHHRLLVWDSVPQSTDTPPDHVLGQASAEHGRPQRGRRGHRGLVLLAVRDRRRRRPVLRRRHRQPPGARLAGRHPRDRPPGRRRARPARRPPTARRTAAGRSRPTPSAGRTTSPAPTPAACSSPTPATTGCSRWDAHPDADRPADAVLGQVDVDDAGPSSPTSPRRGGCASPTR